MIMAQKTLKQHAPSNAAVDYDELQASLNAVKGSLKSSFLSLVWKFKHNEKNLQLDFKPLYLMLAGNENFEAVKDDILCILKIYWLEQTKSSATASSYKAIFGSLCLLVHFLIARQVQQLNSMNLSDFVQFNLVHSWTESGPLKLLNFKSYGVFRNGFDLNKLIISKMSRTQFSLVNSDITQKTIKEAIAFSLDSLSGGELTFADWKNGGSFNFLTLDYGKYYVEHCADFFNEHYPLALSLYETLKDADELVSRAGWPVNRDTKAYLSYCLLNESPVEISEKRKLNLAQVTLLKNLAIERFTDNYLAAQSIVALETPRAKELFLKELKINNLSESQKERLEYLLNYKAWGHERSNIERWISEIDHKSLTLEKFRDAYFSTLSQIDTNSERLKFEINLASKLPSIEFYKSIGLSEPSGSGDGYIIQLYKKVMAAGLTDVCASLGWRESEFGFPFSAIKIQDNNDYLDQEIFPQRFSVDWFVPKTNGETKLNREITYFTFLKIKKLNSFIKNSNDLPCLYLCESSNKNPFSSEAQVQRAVPRMWEHFVNNYAPFTALDKIQELNKLKEKLGANEVLTSDEHNTLRNLEKNYKDNDWERFESDSMLRITFERVKSDFPILKFYFQGQDTKDKKNWVIRYRDRALNSDILDILDNNLSDETKSFIQDLDDIPSAVITRQISAELVQNCIYPTPHALRHMWAEAVYRRFDGDVGWMIRSQFKHISPSMWLAYIKDKSNVAMHEHAQVTVINSIIRSFIAKQGKGYAGKLSSYLTRIIRQTKLINLSDSIELLNEFIANEFVGIKSNPWGYCLLKRRHQHNAKCAENGRPVREKASPSLCLGCTNNLTEATNIDYIYFQIMNDIELLKQTDIPNAYRKESFTNLNNAFKHIKKLNPTHKILGLLSTIVTKEKLAYV